ncbi:MAG: hypothetical protein IJU90_09010 [Bacteroidales bacterium]|nr:hypothetical protein [Bacteroidales bacterium]
MKKLLLAAIMLMFALTMQAQQRCAVFKFQAGDGVDEEDIEGISYMFRSNFAPAGYTVLEHGRVVRAVEQSGFKQTEMTPQQLLKVGRYLDASVIVVGTLSKFMDEYSVTIDVSKVENNQRLASENATFERTEYRDKMKTLAQNLASKLGGRSSSNGNQNGGQTSTSSQIQSGYTDLGLPSGTIWKSFNAAGLYTYDEAVSQFGNRLPSKQQWKELKAECQWTWNGSGYKVTGPNGNSIVLPAAGVRTCDGIMNAVGSVGIYWSSTPYDSDNAWSLIFGSSNVVILGSNQCGEVSVRLVQN